MAILLATMVTSSFGFFYAYFKCWQLSLVLTGFLPLMMIMGVVMMKSMQGKAQISKISYEGASGIAEQVLLLVLRPSPRSRR
jgi:hydrogenase maturation factor